jgi:uncharacterized membrane protein
MTRLRALWWRVSGSLWFVPSIMVLAAVAAAAALIEAEGAFGADLARNWPRLFGAGAEGSREMLSAIATSMITVAGVVFSVTLVALSLAASQYTPRVLRTFMNDRPTQVVLGAFVGVFAYCLVVLRTIRTGEEDYFVPSLAVLGGIALAFIAVGFLVFFIHHLATAIEVSTIVSRVAAGTLRTIAEMYPDECGLSPDDEVRASREAERTGEWTPVMSSASGYVVSVDYDELARYAARHGRAVRMERAIGDFVICGQPIASLSGREPADAAAARELNALYSTDRERTLEQDAAFGIQQIVDIALRALSPGVNDQSTAVMCIDRLSEILVRLARRRVGPFVRRESGGLAVVVAGPDFADLVGLCLDSIRTSAGGKRPVLLRLVSGLERAASAVQGGERAAVLRAQVEAIVETAESTLASQRERQEVAGRARRLAAILSR